ncbi:putative nuclease HARBI1 isoform X1 [Rhipicephalus microplus]|uniref:putative nuclease HARBI1 isoform X1 n=1 Tax=Rhipicephalus microplus TaxID=6941 RepID=UPI003F6B46B9
MEYVLAANAGQRQPSLRKERTFHRRLALDDVPDQHLRYYRFPREHIRALCTTLEPRLQRPTARSRTLPVDVQVLLALRFYASGSFQSMVGDTVGVSQSSASRIVAQVTDALCSLAAEHIRFPTTMRAANAMAIAFSQIAGFPKVLGCIDGTHVQIKPPKGQEHLCRNRKGLYTINVQAICDAEGVITQLTSKWPGSTHDSFTWAYCDLRRCFQRRESPDGWLLGDSGYALEPWLLTPVRSPVGPAEEQYNSAHTRTRQVIERTFGVLKGRFRCLHQSGGALQYNPLMCTKIVVACTMLHNMCVRHGIDFSFTDDDPFLDEGGDDPELPCLQEDTAAGIVRRQVIQAIHSLAEQM